MVYNPKNVTETIQRNFSIVQHILTQVRMQNDVTSRKETSEKESPGHSG